MSLDERKVCKKCGNPFRCPTAQEDRFCRVPYQLPTASEPVEKS